MRVLQLGVHDVAGGPREGSPRTNRRATWLRRSRKYVIILMLIVGLAGMSTIALQFMANAKGRIRYQIRWPWYGLVGHGTHTVGVSDSLNYKNNPKGRFRAGLDIDLPGFDPLTPADGLAPPIIPPTDRRFTGQKIGRCESLFFVGHVFPGMLQYFMNTFVFTVCLSKLSFSFVAFLV